MHANAELEEAPKKAMSRMFTNKCDFNGQRYVWIGACTQSQVACACARNAQAFSTLLPLDKQYVSINTNGFKRMFRDR
jgi:hypothetical protein